MAYTAKSLDGKTVTGELEYHGLMACIRTVTESGYQVTAVDPVSIEYVEGEE